MLAAGELEFQRSITTAFVLADPELITISRYSQVSDGAGGKTESGPTVLTPQTVRLIPSADKVPEQSTLDGRRAQPEFTLIGDTTLNIIRGDRFSWRGRTWEVTQLHDKPEYEFKADVVKHGG